MKNRLFFAAAFVAFGAVLEALTFGATPIVIRIESTQAEQKQPPENQSEETAERLFLGIPAEGWTAIFTFALTVSTIGLWFATRRADKTANISAQAALRAAKAAETSILKADDTARRELRAYITVEANGIEHFGPNSKIIASVRVHNAGKVPARNIRWIFYDAIDAEKLRKRFDVVDQNMEPSTNLLGPGAQMLRFHDCSTRNPDREAFRHGHYAVYVWGKVLYQDGFGKERWTQFCHRYEGDCFDPNAQSTLRPDRARQHQYGNGTDEDEQQGA